MAHESENFGSTRRCSLPEMENGERRYTPEQRLWLHVLRCALFDLRTPDRLSFFYGRALTDEARNWLDSNENYIGSFRYVCEVLGLCHKLVRQGIYREVKSSLQ